LFSVLQTYKFCLLPSNTEAISQILYAFLSMHRALWNLYIVYSPTNALLLTFKKFKIYIKIPINIAATCCGLRPSSESLYRAWLKLYFC